MSSHTVERTGSRLSAWPMFALTVLAAVGAVAFFVRGIVQAEGGDPFVASFVLSVLLVLATSYLGCGFMVLEPNSAAVLILLGTYSGTVREPGWWWVNPLTVGQRRKISLRAHNFNTTPSKVNDANGNPINIAAVVVWQVVDTARAAFDVADYTHFVVVQSETAVRHLARSFPYDLYEEADHMLTLTGDAAEVEATLTRELQARLDVAGVHVIDARMTDLAYAPEIAEAMLRRQQAGAVVAARTRIVAGAVGMVRMALEQIEENRIVDLDEERKATMVSNLLTVLTSEHGTSPVVNVGTLNR
jgi:regulator of protease activity HflC (stomatin/prohibitin superfamily)